VVMDGLHHPFEHGVEQLACFLRVPVGQQLHRALEVGEEHGDVLAFTLKGSLRGQDLLGEMLWGVALRGGEAQARRRRRGLRHTGRRTALLTELRPQLIRSAATRAGGLGRSPALLAETGIAGVVVLAPGTLRHYLMTSSARASTAGGIVRP